MRSSRKHPRSTPLVDNAGLIHRHGSAETSDDDWRRVMAVNLDGAFYGMREIGPRLVANGGGAIEKVSSIGGLIGYPSAPHAASKWASRGLSTTAAGGFSPGNGRVNSIHPGRIETSMLGPLPRRPPALSIAFREGAWPTPRRSRTSWSPHLAGGQVHQRE